MNMCTRGATLDMFNINSWYTQLGLWSLTSTVNTRNTVESVGDVVGGLLCQLSMESTDYKMKGWTKIGFVLGWLYAVLKCALNDTSHVLYALS